LFRAKIFLYFKGKLFKVFMEHTTDIAIESGFVTIATFWGYLGLMILIGIFATKFSSKGINNFFIGDRKMNKLVVAMSAVVSGRSAWLLLGVTGMAYKMGISAIWAAVGYILAEFWLFFSYAPRIRRFSEKYDCITITDFYSERFSDKKSILRIITVIIILLFMISYLSAQFVAGGKTFSTSFNISSNEGLLATAAIILFYTVLGGFLAVSLTDTIQGFFMLFALLALPIIAIFKLGGISNFWNAALSIGGSNFGSLSAISLETLIGFLGIGLGSAGNPHIVVRYMSIDKTKNLSQVAFIGTIMNILMAVGAVFTGIAARIYFPEASMLPGGDVENAYPALAAYKFSPLIFGIVISSIFAAIMSTADSQLLVAASCIVRDIYQKILKRNIEIPQENLVLLSRITILIIVGISLFLAFFAKNIVFWLVLFAWGGLGAAFGPTSILMLFWKKTTRTGVIAGIIAGAFTVIVWNQIPTLKSFVYELIPGFFVSLIVTIIVSLLTKDNDEQKYFDALSS